MSKDLNIGKIITVQQHKDAIHMAVAPVVAQCPLTPGEHVGILPDGTASNTAKPHIGIVDPFLPHKTFAVKEGETFWLFLYPGSITSLHHEWTHPAFEKKPEPEPEFDGSPVRVNRTAGRPKVKGPTMAQVEAERKAAALEAAKLWMRAWAVEHMGDDYDGHVSEDDAFDNAIQAGHHHHVGSYESARDHIDKEWWDNWELITGEKGERNEYFSCAC
jgi:hypothetical protein